jgi:hypothetical protein
MSVMRPVRVALSAASRTDSPAGPARSATSGSVRDRHDGPPAGPDVPAAPDPEIVQGGGRVEGLGCGRAPVDEQRLVAAVLGRESDPAHVARHVDVVPVQPAEAQTALGRVEGHQPQGVQLHLGLPLTDGLRVVRHRGQLFVEPVDGARPEIVQPCVQAADVALFRGEVGLGSGCRHIRLFR